MLVKVPLQARSIASANSTQALPTRLQLAAIMQPLQHQR